MRSKLIVGNLVTVATLGLASFFLVQSYYEVLFAADVESDLGRSRELFERSAQLATRQNVDRVAQRATIGEIQEVFAQSEFMERRVKASGEVDAFAKALGRPEQGGREPELVALTDVRGAILSRNLNANVDVGRPLGEQFRSLSFALNGTPGRDVWRYNGSMLDVSFAPVRREGQVVGALLVGYDVSNGVAEENSRVLGAEIAYFQDGRVYSSSLGSAALQTRLAEYLFKGGGQGPLKEALRVRRETEPLRFDLDGTEYLAIAGPLPGEITARDAGYVVLANVTESMAKVGGANRILWLTLVAALLAIVLGLLLANHFLRPVEQIEEGVLRVINGDTQHRLEIRSAELGGLAYRINQLINELTGVDETDDDEGTGDGDGASQADLEDPTRTS